MTYTYIESITQLAEEAFNRKLYIYNIYKCYIPILSLHNNNMITYIYI